MRIASLNIAHCRYSGVPAMSEYIAASDPDLIFIQEMDRFAARSGGEDQFTLIRERCGYRYGYYQRTLLLDRHGEYGLAAFAREPILEPVPIILSVHHDKEPRVAFAFRLAGHPDTVFCGVHLSQDEEAGRIQLAVLREALQGSRWIIAGDFNAGTDEVCRAMECGEMDVALTWPQDKPAVRLDHIIGSFPLPGGRMSVADTAGLTDHRMVLLDVDEHLL